VLDSGQGCFEAAEEPFKWFLRSNTDFVMVIRTPAPSVSRDRVCSW